MSRLLLDVLLCNVARAGFLTVSALYWPGIIRVGEVSLDRVTLCVSLLSKSTSCGVPVAFVGMDGL